MTQSEIPEKSLVMDDNYFDLGFRTPNLISLENSPFNRSIATLMTDRTDEDEFGGN